MIPPRHADRLIGSIIALVVLAIGLRAGVEVWRHYHPAARVTVEEVMDPAPVHGVCDWIPDHVGCPGARK
jgi:hypothetical protein